MYSMCCAEESKPLLKTFFSASTDAFRPLKTTVPKIFYSLLFMGWCHGGTVLPSGGPYRIDTSDFLQCGKAFVEKRLKKNQGHEGTASFSQSAFLSGRDRCDASVQSRILKMNSVQREKTPSLCCNLCIFFLPRHQIAKMKRLFSFLFFLNLLLSIAFFPQTFYAKRVMPKHLRKKSS